MSTWAQQWSVVVSLRSSVARFQPPGPKLTIAFGTNASREGASPGDPIKVGPADPARGNTREHVRLCVGSIAILLATRRFPGGSLFPPRTRQWQESRGQIVGRISTRVKSQSLASPLLQVS